MLKRYIATALLGSALLVPVAFAAEQPDATNANSTQINTTNASYQGDWRASKLVGVRVYNNNNENVGSINDLLMDKNGTIKAVVIGVGGFLGMGEHLVAVPFDKIKFVDEPVAYASESAPNATGTTPNRPASTTTTGAAPIAPTRPPTTATTPPTTSVPKSDWYPDHAVFNATKNELKAMPEFRYSS
jgi:sporulation protein YlmC with PRC-barrel domain